MLDHLPDLDAAGVLARASEAVQARRWADVLDLQHRLPLTWAVCRRGECEVADGTSRLASLCW